MERTLIIVKPDGVQRGLIGNVITRLEQRGLKFVGLKLLQMTPELAERHYAVHKGKPFYPGLVKHITSGPVVVGVVEGPKAISIVRTTMGATNPAEATPGTIRGDYANQHLLCLLANCPRSSSNKLNSSNLIVASEDARGERISAAY
jgi:nucleoside-diphosphate kinase